MKFEGNWTLSKQPNTVSNYETILQKCLLDSDTFSTFKSINSYSQVVGMDIYGEVAAMTLANIIIDEYPNLLKLTNAFQLNDTIGSPPIHDTPIGRFSPNTLRYLVILGELTKYFGDLTNKRIIEVGGGYGGQCFLISVMYKIKSYTLIDIPSAIKLAQKYLSELSVTNVLYQNVENIKSESSDLFISNFAFTELDDAGCEFYINNIISKTKGFYILTNIFDNARYDFLLNTLRRDFDIEIYQEPPLRRNGSGLWIGKHK